MTELETNAWAFGGPLADAPPDAGWTLFLVAAALCAIFAWFSYRTSVARLGIAPSALLMLLRTAFLVGLLCCLANPVRIERHVSTPPAPPEPPPPLPLRLTVVVDRSDSMTLPDNRGRSRLDDALATWRRLEKTAQTFFGPVQYYSFAEDLRPAATLEEALARTGGTSQTRLYQSISGLLKKPADELPNAIVVLTDGVDTTNEAETLLLDAALSTGTPIYFVGGTNRSARPDPFLRVREWLVPPTALRHSKFSVEVAFEAFSRADRTVPFSLWQSGRPMTRGELVLTTGSNLVSRSFPVAVGEPGLDEFVLRIGPGDGAPVAARAVTRVVPPAEKTTRLVIYQAALDWGFRAFTEALRTDSSFEFLTIFPAEAGAALPQNGPRGSPILGRLPDNAKALAALNCVVLVRPDPRRLTAAQQQALTDFVRGGGAVFFMSPDPAVMPYFAESALKEILPVFVDANAASAPRGTSTPRGKSDQLATFSLTDAGRAGAIFAQGGGSGGVLPRFQEYAAVSRAKPGAEVLAVHPTAVDRESGKPHILLATQTFGRGRTALLTTDTLWRWKLDEPSTSRAVETFWQQLLLTLSRKPEPGVLRFAKVPVQMAVGQTATLRLGGVVSPKLPVVVAKAPDGSTARLAVSLTGDDDTPWSFEWTPAQAGAWEIAAGGLDEVQLVNIFPFVTAEVTGELARSTPALEAMRALAGETGGLLLAQEPPAAWKPAEVKSEKPPETVVSERRHLKWNQWEILIVVLSLYGLELMLRRLWKLI
ncbi:MAG: hypothetical protein ABIZ49_14215 [Opitutaceae bacterium]